MDLKHLRLIRAISEHGGLTAAGRELHLSQPALSQQLANLEFELGTALFHRVGKRMIPTASGKLAAEHGDGLLSAMESLERRVRQSAQATMELRLGVQCYTALHWLPDVMIRFRRTHPRIDLEIVNNATHEPECALLDGRVDIGILNHGGIDSRLRLQELFRDELIVICAPTHPLARHSHIEPEDLVDEEVFVYAVPQGSIKGVGAALSSARRGIGRMTELQWTDPIIAFAAAGMGVGIVPNWVIEKAALRRKIRVLRYTSDGYRRTWSAATLASASVPQAATDFMQMLVAATSKMQASSNPHP